MVVTGQKCRNALTWTNAKRNFLQRAGERLSDAETRVKVG